MNNEEKISGVLKIQKILILKKEKLITQLFTRNPTMKTTFLSYSHKDETFVKKLYKGLVRDGVNCFFDKESIQWGDNWVMSLEKGLDQADFLVVVLSKHFIESEWTKLELLTTLIEDPNNFKKKIKPLLLEPCNIPRFLKPIQAIDVSSDTLFEKHYPKICTALGGQVLKESYEMDRTCLPPICRLPKITNIPFRSLGNRFIGRMADIWLIHDMLHEKQTTIIEGLGIIMGTGGLGKTQTAIEYVHRLGYHYPGGVFWINAEQGLSAMINDIKKTADIELNPRLEDSEQLNKLWQRLSQWGKVLIVLDNFMENEPLQPWLAPTSSIYTLVTTRRRDLDYGRLALEFMTNDEGLALLNSDKRQFDQEAYPLIEILGGLPLALEVTRHFLNKRPNVKIDQLIQEIQKKSELKALSLFAHKYRNDMPTGHNKEVAATFQISVDLVSDEASPVLRIMSMLDAAPVPLRLLAKILALETENRQLS